MSPEIYDDSSKCFDGYAVDLWSLGPILFYMVTGHPPFHSTLDLNYQHINEGRLGFIVNFWEYTLSDELIDLLEKMLSLDPRRRLSLEQIKNHQWMNK